MPPRNDSGTDSSTDYYVGLLSGTSIDAIDAALVAFSSDTAVDSPRLLATLNQPFPARLQAELADAALNDRLTLDAAARLDTELGEVLGRTVLALLDEASMTPGQVRAIGSHGQTLRHEPTTAPTHTIQIGDPNRIAAATGITTVADFRRRDLAAGGQAAPLAPALHAALFASVGEVRAVANLGGIANLTLLPTDGPVRGFDTGPANTLLNAWISECRGEAYDRDGAWAAGGRPQNDWLDALRSDAFFSAPHPKSTGTDYFNLSWVRQRLSTAMPTRDNVMAARDLQATLAELTAVTVCAELEKKLPNCDRLLVCGGGAFNGDLMARLTHHAGIPVESTQDYGLAPDWVEAVLFAWLARKTVHGLPGNLPSVTGAAAPVVLGGIYPGGMGGTWRD